MTAELRRGLMLAGLGVAGGFALIVALFGPNELMKRVNAVISPGELPRTLADRPGRDANAPEKPASPAPGNADQANRGTDGKGAPPASGTRQDGIETLADIGLGKGPAKPGDDARTPSLDIVRVEPNGDAVIAGRVAPNASVEILRDNKPIATVKADPSGQFAVVPPTLPTGNSELSYRSVAPDGTETRGKESVAVVVAENRATKPLVAVSTPDRPTMVLSQPDATSDASPQDKVAAAKKALEGKADGKSPQQLSALPEPKAGKDIAARRAPVKIVSIDAQEGGRLDVTGSAKPGATLRLYLNDTLVGSGKADSEGRLAFTIGRGVRPGGYQVRIDQVERDSGRVEHRAQVAFAFPESAGAKLASREALPPIPGKPDATRKPGDLPANAASPRDNAASAGASPPSAPSAEARAWNRKPEPGQQPPADRAERRPPAQDGASPIAPRSPTPVAEVPANRQPEPGKPTAAASAEPKPDALRPPPGSPPGGETNTAKALPSLAQPAKPAASEPKPPRPVAETPSVAAAAPKQGEPATPMPETDKRTAEALAPKLPQAAGPQTQPASPPVQMPPTAEGMKATPPAATAAATPTPTPLDQPGAVFVPEINTAKISRGDNLWQISRRSYGNGMRYTVIFDANKDQIKDPDLIYPGQIFVLPRDEAGAKRG